MVLLVLSLGITAIGIGIAQAQSQEIPTWIKNTALWYGQDEIGDKDFFQLIQFLIDNQIITIPTQQQDDSEKIKELQSKLNKIELETTKNMQDAYNQGFEKGLGSDQDNNIFSDNCIDEEEAISLAFTTVAISDYRQYIADENSILVVLLDKYQWKILNEIQNYNTKCVKMKSIDNHVLYLLAHFLIDQQITAEDFCTNMANEILGYQECYYVFKPIE